MGAEYFRQQLGRTGINLFITIALGFFLITAAQSAEKTKDAALVIYAVQIVGNYQTKTEFILREMKLRPGVMVTPALIREDELHLSSLGIFNRVNITIASDEGRAVALVTVNEPFYYYLYPVLSYDYRRPERMVWGLGGGHYNFRGQAERLSAVGWNGFNRGFYLTHQDPWFHFSGVYGLESYLSWSDRDLLGDDGAEYRRQTWLFGLETRRRLGRKSWLGFNLEYEDQSSPADFYTWTSKDRDRIVVGRLILQEDHRDYRQYPRSGHFFRSSAEANQILGIRHQFYRESLDLRLYQPYRRFVFAERITGVASQGSLPYYRQVRLESWQIRSGSNLGKGGWMTTAINLELRFNIFPVHYFSLPKIPLAGRYLMNLRYSVEGVIFADWGQIHFSKPQDVNVNVNARSASASTSSSKDVVRQNVRAYGGGLQFQLPYIDVAHILVGWRPEFTINQPTYSLGLGVTF
ncbi:MAG: POTRA domain-containing protein [Calditrichota bacterium]